MDASEESRVARTEELASVGVLVDAVFVAEVKAEGVVVGVM